jgi:hypothetical protein
MYAMKVSVKVPDLHGTINFLLIYSGKFHVTTYIGNVYIALIHRHVFRPTSSDSSHTCRFVEYGGHLRLSLIS